MCKIIQKQLLSLLFFVSIFMMFSCENTVEGDGGNWEKYIDIITVSKICDIELFEFGGTKEDWNRYVAPNIGNFESFKNATIKCSDGEFKIKQNEDDPYL